MEILSASTSLRFSMLWILKFTLLLLSSGFAPSADSFSFDVSPMTIRECSARPTNNCGPTMLAQSDCRFLEGSGRRRSGTRMETLNKTDDVYFDRNGAPVVTFVTLHCNYQQSSRKNVTKQDLRPHIAAVRKRSRSRAVKIEFLECALFGDDTVGLISDQIVFLALTNCRDPLITSQLRSFVNMIQLTLRDSHIPITVHKSDFTPLQKIRIIIFENSPIEHLELGTFTDLPDLMTFALERSPFFGLENAAFLSTRDRLHCDHGNDWIWKWLKQHPDLQKNRIPGEVFEVGSLKNDFVDYFRTSRMTCYQNGTISDRSGKRSL